MKNQTITQVLIMITAAGVASAQHAGGAAAVRAVPAIPAAPSAAATVRAVPAVPPAPSVSASGSAASSAAVHAPTLPPNASAQGRAHAGMSNSPSGLNSNAATHASAQGQANGLSVATVASDRTRETLRMDETVHAIRAANFAERGTVTTEVEVRLDATDKVVDDLDTQAKGADSKSRAALAAALVDVRKQQRQVRADLRAATRAAGETNWGSVQSELAKSYGDYAKAVAKAQAAADATVETPKS